MPSLTVAGTTGEGTQDLGGNRVVTNVSAHMTSLNPKQTRIVGQMFPRGIWHAGSFGLGDFPGDSSGAALAIVLVDWFLHYESQMAWVPQRPVVTPTAATLWWRWLPGVTVDLVVFY